MPTSISILLFVDWTPWLAQTPRQFKTVTLVIIGVLLMAVAVLAAFRLLRRLRKGTDEIDVRKGTDEIEAPSPRVVDAAIANLLEQAAPVDGDERSEDELFKGVVQITVELGGVSIPAIQRRLHLDFDRASRFVERMAEEGMLSEPGTGGKRKITARAEEYVASGE